MLLSSNFGEGVVHCVVHAELSCYVGPCKMNVSAPPYLPIWGKFAWAASDSLGRKAEVPLPFENFCTELALN